MSIPGEDLQRVRFHGKMDLSFDTIAFVVLSSILACGALLNNSVPVLIGAMILAPVFDPLVAIPFSIVNRDWPLLRRGAFNSLMLFSISMGVCFGAAWIFLNLPITSTAVHMSDRTMLLERLTVGWQSLVTAITAGAGGALASAARQTQNLVGVVVALALIPAIAAAAIGFQAGPLPGWGGLELFGVNVGGIIASGLIVLSLRVGTGRTEEQMARNRQSGER